MTRRVRICERGKRVGPVSAKRSILLGTAFPEPLDWVAVVLDPGRAGDRRLVALRRDCWARTDVWNVLAEDGAGVAAIAENPFRPTRMLADEAHRLPQFLELTRRQPEGNGAA